MKEREEGNDEVKKSKDRGRNGENEVRKEGREEHERR